MRVTETDRNINKLSPNFKLKVIDFIEEVWKTVFITEWFRSDARQEYLYNKTPKVTWVKHSNHQDWNAIDIAFKWSSLYPNDIEKWKQISLVAKKYWIDWGFDLWKTDKPHFQDNLKPYTKEETMFWPNVTRYWITYPSSVYWIPVRLWKTTSKTLVWYANIKWYAPRARKDEILIFQNTLDKWEYYTKKVILHELFHFFQQLVFSDEQNKYLEDLYKFIPENVSAYAATLHREDGAESFSFWETYIKDEIELPVNKKWSDAIEFKYVACKQFADSRTEKLKALIQERK